MKQNEEKLKKQMDEIKEFKQIIQNKKKKDDEEKKKNLNLEKKI